MVGTWEGDRAPSRLSSVRGYTRFVPPKDPHVVLGVDPGASPDTIKAAWRRLARRHHPDLTGDDPDAVRRATSRMAEINTAYAALTRDDRAAARRARAETRAQGRRDEAAAGPPPPRPGRPVTGRVDLSGTVRPRNQTTSPPGSRTPLVGHPPLRHERHPPDLRASDPTGPTEFGRLAGHESLQPPSLDEALDRELAFGKFHGHSLGEVAAFEPSYIDWLAGTVVRDPELAAAARVIADELDRQGIRRPQRPTRPGWRSNPFL